MVGALWSKRSPFLASCFASHPSVMNLAICDLIYFFNLAILVYEAISYFNAKLSTIWFMYFGFVISISCTPTRSLMSISNLKTGCFLTTAGCGSSLLIWLNMLECDWLMLTLKMPLFEETSLATLTTCGMRAVALFLFLAFLEEESCFAGEISVLWAVVWGLVAARLAGVVWLEMDPPRLPAVDCNFRWTALSGVLLGAW